MLKKFFTSVLFILFSFVLPSSLVAQSFYWESPERISTSDSRFPSAVSNNQNAAIFWQEIDGNQIWLSGQFKRGSVIGESTEASATSSSNSTWQTRRRFAGPFPYSGSIPDLYSSAMSKKGTIVVSVLSDPSTISLFISDDNGASFTRKDFERQEFPLVAPRIYDLESGGFILFTSLGKDESFSMLYTRSSDGKNWSNFSNFSPAEDSRNPFLPVLCSTKSGELVIFQAQFNTGTRLSYQLYSTRSSNSGLSWSSPVLITDQTSVISQTQNYTSYHNQRPTILSNKNGVYVAWERQLYTSENSHIFFSEINPSTGKFVGQVEEITTEGNANRPVLFSYKDVLSLVWFDTRRGAETVYFAQKNGFMWQEQLLSPGTNSCVFAYPAISDSGEELSFVWETDYQSNRTPPGIFRLSTDRTVLPPTIVTQSYNVGSRQTSSKVRFSVNLPRDSSDIAGFSWVWTQDKDAKVPRRIMNLPRQRNLEVEASTDKEWFFKVCAIDYAGNWSPPAIVSYYRDITAPLPPKINAPTLDQNGFVNTNSFDVTWTPNPDDTEEIVAGYSWRLEEISSLPRSLVTSSRHPTKLTDEEIKDGLAQYLLEHPSSELKPSSPPSRIMTRNEGTHITNSRNGYYTFSVCAIDTVGNVSQPSYITLYLNKFEPYTWLSSVRKSSDLFGNITLELIGAGFTYDGTIDKIYIDKDGNAPYDMEFAIGEYRVLSDSSITGIKLGNNIPEGNYRIVLHHTDRGLYRSNVAFSVTETGTVKIENSYEYIPEWKAVAKHLGFALQMGDVLLVVVLLLALLGFVFAIKGISSSVRDGAVVAMEVQALITGDLMPEEKKARMTVLKKKGISLKVKLVAFTVFLVLMVSLLVSIPLGYIMIRTQERTLTKGLEDRANVLMESLSSGVRTYMPSQNILELSYLPSQSSALEEASYVTITGLNADGTNTNLDYVWATNDSEILEKIDSSEFNAGVSRLQNDAFKSIFEDCAKLNEQASSVSTMSQDIAKLNTEGASLVLRTDSASVARRNEIANITTQLTTRMTNTLSEISIKGSGSYPAFNSEKLDRKNTDYIFYRPVLYRLGSSQNYVRGVVFISLSTKVLIKSIDSARNTIVFTALGISLLAIIIGSIGAYILASVIVTPIRRLASHVTMIGETVNKEKLAGKDIIIKSQDEIGQLGESVNEMTHGLIKAAQDEKLLMDGKVVQQAFIPLLSDSSGNKQSTAVLEDPKVECFGYYEGASGVSGDYFDYKKLDERWYVVIKCDVSGHGVPAALIMTVVATLFRRYFENWSFEKNGTHLDKLVTQINDFIESLGLRGKFATIILALVDTKTGDVYLCNAGDNIVHLYDSNAHKVNTLTLKETPAAGPMPSFMVDMKGGFAIEKIHINKGDILFLYTDGIEESTRKCRDSTYAVIQNTETDASGNQKVSDVNELLEADRVIEIIECVLNKRVYELKKDRNPVPNEKLIFDFTSCEGTLEEVIIALASVEKIFRFYKDNYTTNADTVRTDKKIDTFLKTHFNLYNSYCSNIQDDPDNKESSYLYYAGLKEDEQLDDLTLLAIKSL